MNQSPEAMKVWREAQSAYREGRGPRNQVAASVIEAALQKARDEEREAVVDWLRNCTDGAPEHPLEYTS